MRYFRLLIGGFALLGAQLSFSDTPMGVYYQMQVSDPGAVVAAMTEFQNSETAKDRKVTFDTDAQDGSKRVQETPPSPESERPSGGSSGSPLAVLSDSSSSGARKRPRILP